MNDVVREVARGFELCNELINLVLDARCRDTLSANCAYLIIPTA